MSRSLAALEYYLRNQESFLHIEDIDEILKAVSLECKKEVQKRATHNYYVKNAEKIKSEANARYHNKKNKVKTAAAAVPVIYNDIESEGEMIDTAPCSIV